jgi:hypothetical protein
LPTFAARTPTDRLPGGYAGSAKRSVWNQIIIPISIVHGTGNRDLVLIAEAIRTRGFALGLGQRGQQHGREDGNDRDNNEQFDQSESVRSFRTIMTQNTGPRLASYFHINWANIRFSAIFEY